MSNFYNNLTLTNLIWIRIISNKVTRKYLWKKQNVERFHHQYGDPDAFLFTQIENRRKSVYVYIMKEDKFSGLFSLYTIGTLNLKPTPSLTRKIISIYTWNQWDLGQTWVPCYLFAASETRISEKRIYLVVFSRRLGARDCFPPKEWKSLSKYGLVLSFEILRLVWNPTVVENNMRNLMVLDLLYQLKNKGK